VKKSGAPAVSKVVDKAKEVHTDVLAGAALGAAKGPAEVVVPDTQQAPPAQAPPAPAPWQPEPAQQLPEPPAPVPQPEQHPHHQP
jgi:hypothetical protein